MTVNGKARPWIAIGLRLKWLREQTKLSQDDYAKAIGAQRSSYVNWETGASEITRNAARGIKQRYGISLDFIFDGEDGNLPNDVRMSWRDHLSESSSK